MGLLRNHSHDAKNPPAVKPAGFAQPIPRLTADLNSSYSPAVARLDAMRNQAAIAPCRIVGAEAGGIAAPDADAEAANALCSGHYGWLNQADSRQCDHGYNRFPHRASLHAGAH
jgi:hypothetical protein